MKTMKKIVAVLAVALMLCSVLPLSVMAADTYELASSITVGDTVVLACTSKSMELSGMNGTSYGLGTAYTGTPVGTYALSVEEGSSAGTYAFKTVDGTYLAWSSGNSLKTISTINASSSWTVTFNGTTATIANVGTSTRKLQWNASNPRFACYTSTQTAVNLYKKVVNSNPDCDHVWVDANCTTAKTCSACGATDGEALGHSYGEATETVAPDCTNAGEQQSTCSVCGDVKTETVKALGHTYVDGFCSECGEAQPLEATITFDDKSKMTSSSTSQQVWEENGIVITYDKNTYNSNLVEYANPVRFYAGTKVTIAYPGMTKVVIVANNSTYANAVNSALSGSTVSGSTVTYECAATDSVSFVLTAQARVNSITVYGSAPSDCEHDYVGVETQAPTCTVEGLMTYTCSKCEESYTEAIATIPHNYGEGVETQAPDCTNAGVKTYTCPDCGDVKTEEIPANGHNYVDDVCDVCGAVKAYKGTITFDADKTQRTEYSTQIQVWENEGLTFTNNKGTGNNVGDYGAPIRIYKNSEIVIAFPEMSRLIIDASGIGDDYLWDATLADYTVTAEDGIYTITFAEPVNSLTLTAANQVRANSITAIAAHECAWVDATCTAPKTCSKCGATEGEALGHSYFYPCDVVCQVCYEETNPDATHNIVAVEAVEATCTENGNIAYWYCSDCGAAWADEALTQMTNRFNVIVPATGEHTYDHSEDTDCNDCGAIRPVDYMLSNFGGNSISEDVNGLAFQYTMEISGIQIKEGTTNEADFTNATAVINSVSEPVKVLGMGAIVTNNYSPTLVDYVDGKNVIDVPAVYMTDLEADTATFAVRVINIPDHGKDTDICVRPYLIYEDQFGNVIRWYGLEDWTSYNQVAG